MKLKLLFILLCIHIYTFSQYSLTGVIIHDDGTGKIPINQIHVNVMESNISAITNSLGEFKIHNLQSGKYTLKIISDRSNFLGIVFKNVLVNSDTRLDTIFLTLFFAPIQDLTLGGFGSVLSMKEYYKNNGLLVYDTSEYNYYSHGYFCRKLDMPVKDSIDHYYRQGEWKWSDRSVIFEGGVLNGPTLGYNESKKFGYSGFYKNDKLEGLWEFYDKRSNETFQAEFEEGNLLIDLNTVSIKEVDKLIKRIKEIY